MSNLTGQRNCTIQNMNVMTVKNQNTKSSENLTVDASSKTFHVHQNKMSMTCIPPCTPFLYSNTGVWRGIAIFFLFLLQNIDCWYLLEPPR